MSDFNRVFLLGRIGNDLELKSSAQGNPYVRLSIATNSIRANDEKVTYWHRVMVFGAQAEVCAKYLRKGSQVFLEGSLEVRTWHDEKLDRKMTTVSVIARSVQFVGGRKSVEVVPEEGAHREDALAEGEGSGETGMDVEAEVA